MRIHDLERQLKLEIKLRTDISHEMRIARELAQEMHADLTQLSYRLQHANIVFEVQIPTLPWVKK